MSLSLIFRLNAAFGLLWGIQLIFLPNMMFAMYGWAPSVGLIALAQAAGTAMIGIAILSFGLPNWTSEGQLKTAAKSLVSYSGFIYTPSIVSNTDFSISSWGSYGLD